MENVKNGAKLSAIIGIAFVYMTTFFGGGWATGSQGNIYAASHGWAGIFMPLVGLALIMVVTWITVEYCRLFNVWNYGDFMEKLYGTKVIKFIFDIIQVTCLPISFAVSVATFSSAMQGVLGGAYLMWVVIFCAIVLFSVIWGTAFVNKLAAYMGTAILLLLLVICVTFTANGGGETVGEIVANRTMFTSYGEAFKWGGLKLWMITGGLVLSILPSFEPVKTRSDVTKTCLFSFLFCGAFLLIVSYNVMCFAPESFAETVPVLYGIQKIGADWLQAVYILVVDLAVITTANAMCNGYGRRFMSWGFVKKSRLRTVPKSSSSASSFWCSPALLACWA